jgi:hypothetical protein
MTRSLALMLPILALACGDDTKTDDTGPTTTTLTVSASLDGVDLPGLPFTVEDEDGAVLGSGSTGGDVEVVLGDDEAWVWLGAEGSDATADGHRIVEVDGVRYVHQQVLVEGQAKSDIGLNTYVNIPNCVCHLVGNDGWEDDYPEGNIEVQEGSELWFDGSLNDNSWLEILGSTLTIEGEEAEHGNHLVAYQLNEASVSFDIDDGYEMVDSFTCE